MLSVAQKQLSLWGALVRCGRREEETTDKRSVENHPGYRGFVLFARDEKIESSEFAPRVHGIHPYLHECSCSAAHAPPPDLI